MTDQSSLTPEQAALGVRFSEAQMKELAGHLLTAGFDPARVAAALALELKAKAERAQKYQQPEPDPDIADCMTAAETDAALGLPAQPQQRPLRSITTDEFRAFALEPTDNHLRASVAAFLLDTGRYTGGESGVLRAAAAILMGLPADPELLHVAEKNATGTSALTDQQSGPFYVKWAAWLPKVFHNAMHRDWGEYRPRVSPEVPRGTPHDKLNAVNAKTRRKAVTQ